METTSDASNDNTPIRTKAGTRVELEYGGSFAISPTAPTAEARAASSPARTQRRARGDVARYTASRQSSRRGVLVLARTSPETAGRDACAPSSTARGRWEY